ncbi:hypothetical protein [Nocardioides immobilis]|nr:hypothetical protein [Nocardioides immobilis]
MIDWAGSSRTTPRAHRSPGEGSVAFFVSGVPDHHHEENPE